MCGVNDVKEVIKVAVNERKFKRKTILFMDEIHRFNKLQQVVSLHTRSKCTIDRNAQLGHISTSCWKWSNYVDRCYNRKSKFQFELSIAQSMSCDYSGENRKRLYVPDFVSVAENIRCDNTWRDRRATQNREHRLYTKVRSNKTVQTILVSC